MHACSEIQEQKPSESAELQTLTKEKSQWWQNKRQKIKGEGQKKKSDLPLNALVPEGVWGPLWQNANQNNGKPGSITSFPSRIHHLPQRTIVLAAHVAERKDINYVDTHTENKNKKQWPSILLWWGLMWESHLTFLSLNDTFSKTGGNDDVHRRGCRHQMR